MSSIPLSHTCIITKSINMHDGSDIRPFKPYLNLLNFLDFTAELHDMNFSTVNNCINNLITLH